MSAPWPRWLTRQLFTVLIAWQLTLIPSGVTARPVVLEEVAKIASPDSDYSFGLSFGHFRAGVVALEGNDLLVTARTIQFHGGYGLFHFERQSDGTWLSRGLVATAPTQDVENPNKVVLEDGVAVWTADRSQGQILERTASGWRTTMLPFGTAAGSDVGVNNGVIAIGDEGGGRARVLILEKNAAGEWAATDTLEGAPSFPDNDFLGPDIELADGELIAANRFDDTGSGAAETHFFELIAGNWQRTAIFPEIRSAVPMNGDLAFQETGTRETGDILFLDRRDASGAWTIRTRLRSEESFTNMQPGPVVVRGDRAYTGTPQNDLRGDDTGSVNVFAQDAPDRFTHIATLVASDAFVIENPNPFGSPFTTRLGQNIAVSGNTIAAAGFSAPAPGSDTIEGAIYIFELPEALPESVRVEDDFEDMNAAGWTPQGNTNWRVLVSNNNYVFRQTNMQGDARAILDAPLSQNQSIQADVKVNSFPTGWVGLMVRYTDPLNFYYLLADNKSIEIRRIVNGAFGPIASVPFSVVPGRTYRLRLEAVGTWLRLYVDSRLVTQVRDDSHSEGRAGLTMRKTNAEFDNVIVSTSPYTFLHTDSFSNTSEEAALPWSTTPAGAWTYATRSSGATVLRQNTIAGDARAVNGAPARDQIVMADIRPTSFHANGGWVGLMTRYVDTRNYYYVLLTSDNLASLRKWSNGRITVLDEVSMTINPGTSYRVRFEAIGSSLRLYINDRLRAEAKDSELPQGRYGLVTYHATAEFDTFTAARP